VYLELELIKTKLLVIKAKPRISMKINSQIARNRIGFGNNLQTKEFTPYKQKTGAMNNSAVK
jgi:hypothetical protein